MNERISPDDQLALYRLLLRLRFFEEEVVRLYMAGELPGFIHPYLGEEAVASGVCFNLRRDDYITSTHRGHGHCLAKGAAMKAMMAELYAKTTGCCGGHGGSMHIADFGLGILGANGIVGAGLPIAVGAGLAITLKNRDQVVACFFGDGACNQGAFHEAINLAAIWNLPVVFVCENNQYAISMSRAAHTKIADIAIRSSSYGITGLTVDGNDVLAVSAASIDAINKARSGGGPTLMVCETYRSMGHYVGDPCIYREKAEEERWKDEDPILKQRRRLFESGLLDEKKNRDIERAIKSELEAAIDFARSSRGSANTEDIFKCVYLDEENKPCGS